jgi:hypothetical protein
LAAINQSGVIQCSTHYSNDILAASWIEGGPEKNSHFRICLLLVASILISQASWKAYADEVCSKLIVERFQEEPMLGC